VVSTLNEYTSCDRDRVIIEVESGDQKKMFPRGFESGKGKMEARGSLDISRLESRVRPSKLEEKLKT